MRKEDMKIKLGPLSPSNETSNTPFVPPITPVAGAVSLSIKLIKIKTNTVNIPIIKNKTTHIHHKNWFALQPAKR